LPGNIAGRRHSTRRSAVRCVAAASAAGPPESDAHRSGGVQAEEPLDFIDGAGLDGSADDVGGVGDQRVDLPCLGNRGIDVSLIGDVQSQALVYVEISERVLEQYLEILEPLFGTRERATVALATLVGAITLARAVDKPALAEEILRDVRAALKSARD
jgi:hypothetical protein